jgi:hypothetical protein
MKILNEIEQKFTDQVQPASSIGEWPRPVMTDGFNLPGPLRVRTHIGYFQSCTLCGGTAESKILTMLHRATGASD